MKAQILKIAGVKSEKEFYKKYPSEEAFMKVHGKAFKKAQIGAFIGGDTTTNAKPLNYQTYYDDVDKLITGSTEKERQEAAYKQAELKASSEKASGVQDLLGMIKSGMGGEEGDTDSIEGLMGGAGGGSVGEGIMSSGGFGAIGGGIGGGRNGRRIPVAQNSVTGGIPSGIGYTPNAQQVGMNQFNSPAPTFQNNFNPQPLQYGNGPISNGIFDRGGVPDSGGGGFMDKAMSAIPVVGSIFGGIKALGAEKEAAKAAKQQKTVSGLQLTASATRPEETQRRYVRPEDVTIQPNQMFPTYGVGTNVLARDGVRLYSGGEIQNTYAPDYLYDDLGYEPLNDSEQVKQYYHGGGIPKAQGGFSNYASTLGGGGSGFSGAGAGGGTPWGAIGGIGSGMANSAAGGGNAGGQIGGGIGEGVGAIFGPAGMAIGKTLGTAVGNAVDPYAKAIKRDTAATKRNIENTAYNNMAPGFIAPYQAYARDGSSIPNYEEGGYMNPEYNPQLITMFGDHTAEDFADYANKYRAGGHLKSYTPPSDRAMETYAMGGQLQTHWGGGAETLSHNPYMPGSGETVLFRGQSHTESDGNGQTGIGITYGDSPVEVERGEPMFEMQAGGEINPQTGEPENTGVVFGNMMVDKRVASQLNDPELMEIANKYHGKKFKNIGIELSKEEAKHNKAIAKNIKELDSFEVRTSIDKARFAALKANIEGNDSKLKQIANTKIIFANYQNAINDSKDEISEAIGNNISAEDLAKGRVKPDKDPVTMNAKWGGNIAKKAKAGETTTDPPTSFPSDKAARDKGYTWTGKYESDGKTKIYERTIKKYSNKTDESKAATAMDKIPVQKLDKNTGFAGEVTKEKFEQFKKRFPDYPGIDKLDPKDPISLHDFKTWYNNKAKEMGSTARIMDDPKTKSNPQGLPIFGNQFVSATLDESKKATPAETEETLRATVAGPGEQPEAEKIKTPWWAIAANTILPYIRPTDQEGLDMAQLYPEMYALGSNQLEPVPAQGYRPDLGTPYDISFQDQLNANQADYNASQKMVGYNPAAQSVLNAQKYAANTNVLGSQFRANQEMKDKVYGENRNILNQAKLTNLDIFDRQYGRQAEARSNTKATTLAALNSIADKYAKQKLENRTLGIYENMYNYRFDKNGRAQNYNPLQLFDTQMGGAKAKGSDSMPGYKATSYDKDGNVLTWKKITSKDDVDDTDLEAVGGIKGKNGESVKKNNKNSSVVRAYKNL